MRINEKIRKFSRVDKKSFQSFFLFFGNGFDGVRWSKNTRKRGARAQRYKC